jgi:hypothetical protein
MAEHGLLVHGGPPMAAAKRHTGVRPCGHSGGWELTESSGKGRGAQGGGGSSPWVQKGVTVKEQGWRQ